MFNAENSLFSIVNGGGRARYEIEIGGLRARVYLHSVRWEYVKSLWAGDGNRKLVLTTGYQDNNQIRDIITIYGVTNIEILRENNGVAVFSITTEVNEKRHHHKIYAEYKRAAEPDDENVKKADFVDPFCVEQL